MADHIDFSSGLPAARDGATPRQPADQPTFGENHAFWIHDEASGLQINGHLITCEDIGAYDLRLAKLSITRPDGRAYLVRQAGAGSDAETASSANLRFRRLEPFRRWSCHFNGVVQDVTVTRSYMSGAPLDYPRVPVRFEIETEMAAPVWIQGAFTEGGLGPVKAFMGGERYEQLFRGDGVLTIGDEAIAVSGFGNRTHRTGTRDLSATADAPPMLGHVWAAALFPSGAGFGLQIFPTADGGILWAEGYVLRQGRLAPADVVRAPWLRSYWPRGEGVEIVLRTRDGETTEISGETLGTVIGHRAAGATLGEHLLLFQSHARYTMGGETAINMLERSLRRSCIETGIGRP